MQLVTREASYLELQRKLIKHFKIDSVRMRQIFYPLIELIMYVILLCFLDYIFDLTYVGVIKKCIIVFIEVNSFELFPFLYKGLFFSISTLFLINTYINKKSIKI